MSAISILYPICDAYQDRGGEDVKARLGGVALTNGLIVYDDPTTGKMKISDAAGGATTQQVYGINITGYSTGIGQAVTVMRHGVVAGFDLSGLNFGALVYLSTAGGIDTAANGTKTVVIGKVVGSSETDSSGNVKKLLAVDFADLSVIT
jgi:hypothetical protein